MKMIYETLKELRERTQHVLCVDAFDTVIVDNLDVILEKYRGLNHPLVFSAETSCYPYQEKASLYPACDTPYRFLNAGGWLAETDYMISVLEEIEVESIPDEANDQGVWTDFFLSNPSALRLDTRCEVFQSLFGAMGDMEFVDGIANRITGTRPSVLHGNGPTDMSRIHEWAGLKINSSPLL
jgi:hypothetical protein